MPTQRTVSNRNRASRDDVVGSGPVLVLSPHMDDALLGASHVILGGPCEVWTVFAGRPVPPVTTTWDISCGFADSDEAISIREAEDAAAFAGTPATAHRFSGIEGAYTTPERRAKDLVTFEAELRRWMQEHPSGTVLLPAGAGVRVPAAWYDGLLQRWRDASARRGAQGEASLDSAPSPAAPDHPSEQRGLLGRLKATVFSTVRSGMHAAYLRRRSKATRRGMGSNPDHLEVRDHALDVLAQAPTARVVAYEELPYSWHQAADDEVADLVARRGLQAQALTIEIDREVKAARIAPYRSQLHVIDDAGRLLSADTLPATERYWVLASGRD